jgi:hypothetical protein
MAAAVLGHWTSMTFLLVPRAITFAADKKL